RPARAAAARRGDVDIPRVRGGRCLQRAGRALLPTRVAPRAHHPRWVSTTLVSRRALRALLNQLRGGGRRGLPRREKHGRGANNSVELLEQVERDREGE